MRIIHVIRNFEIGGLETIVCRLAKAQLKLGHDVSVICIEKERGATINCGGEGLEVYYVNKTNSFNGLVKVFYKILKTSPDVLHTHNFLANVYGAYTARLLGVPVTLTLHSGTDRYLEEFLRSSMFVPKHIVCVSDEIRNTMVSINPKLVDIPTSVIKNGIDPSGFSPNSQIDIGSLLSEFNFHKDNCIIGAVGRLHEVKNHRTLLKAFRKVCERNENARLLLIGEGDLLDDLIDYSVKLGVGEKVCFTGSRTDIPDLLQLMHIFVLPSLKEGTPISLLEAMSSKRPIIASTVGAIPQILTDKVNGYLIDPTDADCLADRIIHLLENPGVAQKMGNYALETVEAGYSIGSMCEAYHRVYSEIQ